ncbi:MAG: heavy metal translocating P-type ATPase [Verrucomicrobia bacterium]|nr:MAG: heavy metal translocating P-type ATPase [Verrucomicrobiota bacterium]
MAVEQNQRGNGHTGAGQVTQLAVTGMTCGNCARHVMEAIQNVPGVRTASVNLDARQATVRWKPDSEAKPQALIEAVEQEGFGAKVLQPQTQSTGEESLPGWQWNLWLGVPITAFLMMGEWAIGLNTAPWFRWASFGLAAVVQVFAGAQFYRGAWSQLKVGASNMDTLVALGSTTAFGYSAWLLLGGQGGHLYFMEAAAIITLISLGHWVESRVSARASGALRKLLHLAPDSARRRLPDGSEAVVPVAELKTGDLVVLRPGDRVPTDGVVVEGTSAVDEAMLTGESAPVDKKLASELYAGTLNLNGHVLMRITATGEETALAHIIQAVQRAQNSRANIQRLGDRVSSVFVPVIVCIALGAGLFWGLAPQAAQHVHEWLGHFLWAKHPPEGALAAGIMIAAAVLIVACPCAMGLATPAAIMAGSNAAAERGILIRDGVALEKAGQITAVLFDKTGTLTLGRPTVAEVWTVDGEWERTEDRGQRTEDRGRGSTVKRVASSLARHSNHPISQAVAALAAGGSELTDWRELPGAGVEAQLPGQWSVVSGQWSRLGSLRWLSAVGVDLEPGRDFARLWSEKGATVIGLSFGQQLGALIALTDSMKAGAAEVIARLHAEGLRTYLVTGDNSVTAATISAKAGIPAENVFSEVRPEQKAALVTKLQKEGQRVAFIGDGINDAPALEQADLGIAVSRANDIAREAADIILLNSEIEAVPESLGLARATLRVIKQNLFWAFFYNVMGVPLAALGFMSPIICAAAMACSDLVVIGNALRLRRWRHKPDAS